MERQIKRVDMLGRGKIGGDSRYKIGGTGYLSKCLGLGLCHEGENKGYIYHDPVIFRRTSKYGEFSFKNRLEDFLKEADKFFKGLKEVKACASGIRIDSDDEREVVEEFMFIRDNLPPYLSEWGIPIENFWAKYPDENESGIIRIDTLKKFFGVGMKRLGERIIYWYPFKESDPLFETRV